MLRLLLLALASVIALGSYSETADAKKRKWKKKRVSYKARVVEVNFGLPKGTIVIVNWQRRLYYTLGNGKAKRYRVAVGERDELWTGRTFISMMRENPDWHPVDGSPMVEGGKPGNPLGKRALYLDWSLLRIHGTPYRRSIGGSVSNGCIRMYNEDVIDLANRVHLGAPVIAVNRIRDIWKFREDKFTGKLPAWKGQVAVWKEQDREMARARKRGMTLRDYRRWLKTSGARRRVAGSTVSRSRRARSRRATVRRANTRRSGYRRIRRR
ncbi:MAG: L,D-transpeptidase [Pseudomonadota bacterium]